MRAYQVAILAGICLIIAIIIIKTNNLNWDSNSSSFLSFVSVLVAVGTLIITIVYESFKSDNELKDRIIRTIQTLQNDVKLIELGFEIKDSSVTKRGYKYEKNEPLRIHITYMQIGTEVYDSILSSGLFTYFQKESQSTLGDFYFNCKLHNHQLSEIRRFEYERKVGYGTAIDSVYGEADIELKQRLTTCEKDIKELFRKLRHYLDEESKKANAFNYKFSKYSDEDQAKNSK